MRRSAVSCWVLAVPACSQLPSCGAAQALRRKRRTKRRPLPPLRALRSPCQPRSHPATPEELGDSLSAHQRYQAAIAAYGKAPQMTAAIWNKMGIAYQMMFNSKDATRCYQESLKLDPRNSQVLNNLGTVYASLEAVWAGRPHVSQGSQARPALGDHS